MGEGLEDEAKFEFGMHFKIDSVFLVLQMVQAVDNISVCGRVFHCDEVTVRQAPIDGHEEGNNIVMSHRPRHSSSG
jgi:hypothetical protein